MTQTRNFDAVVIGSGLGGLTAAGLLARSGHGVLVLERNRSFGGAASCYRVGELTIEAALHETADPNDPREPKHGVLDRLGLLGKVDWLQVPQFQTVIGGPVGEAFTLDHGFHRPAELLCERFPGRADGIRRVLSRMEHAFETTGSLTEAGESGHLGGLVRAVPGLLPILSDWKLSLAQAFERDLGDCEGAKCALAANLPYYSDDPRRLWWMAFAVAQGGYLGSGGYFPRGGSTSLTRAMVKVIKRDGGEILLGRRATRIEQDADGRPVAVRHCDRDGGDEQRVATRTVLANCAPHAVAGMIAEDRRSGFMARYDGMSPSISLFSAHFGLDTQPAAFGLGHYSTILLPDWMTRLDDYAEAGGLLAAAPAGRLPPLAVVNYGAVDSGLGEGGRTLVSVVGVDRLENWLGLSREEEAARRAAWLDAVLEELERRFPGFAGSVKEKVIVTARSMRDYLGTPGGAIYGFDPAPPRHSFLSGMARSPRTAMPGLFLASSFAGAGGFTGAIRSGAGAARLAGKVLRSR